MTEAMDEKGRSIIVPEETCRHCGRSSKGRHPGGVVPGRWRCNCGRTQHEADEQRTQSEVGE